MGIMSLSPVKWKLISVNHQQEKKIQECAAFFKQKTAFIIN